MRFLTQPWLRLLDAMANKSMAAYYIFVWLLTIIGYGFVFIFPLLTVIAITYIIKSSISSSPLTWGTDQWIPILTMLVIGSASAWISLKIFRIKPDLPAGKPMEADAFPRLFEFIHEYQEAYNAPKYHNVKLIPEFEIKIIRTPVCGFPVKYKNTLLIGLPILLGLSELHFKILLARQIGYLAQTRSHLSRHIVYIRDILNIYKRIYSSSWKPETILLRLFYSWYSPFYSVCTRTMVRFQAYIKDSCMQDIAPSEVIAEAMAVYHVKKLYIETIFWPQLLNAAYDMENPPYLPNQSTSRMIEENLDQERIQSLVESELLKETETGSVIPSLKCRLQELGYDSLYISDQYIGTNAKDLLGDQLITISKQMDNIWYLKNKKEWMMKYQIGAEEKEKLNSMIQQASHGSFTNRDINTYLSLIKKYVDPDQALSLYKVIIEKYELDGDVYYELGKALIKADDALGPPALDAAMKKQPALTVECCNYIVEYMVRHGDNAQAQTYRRLILEFKAEN